MKKLIYFATIVAILALIASGATMLYQLDLKKKITSIEAKIDVAPDSTATMSAIRQNRLDWLAEEFVSLNDILSDQQMLQAAYADDSVYRSIPEAMLREIATNQLLKYQKATRFTIVDEFRHRYRLQYTLIPDEEPAQAPADTAHAIPHHTLDSILRDTTQTH